MLGRFARFELLQWRSDFGPFCLDCEGFFGARVWVWVFIFFGDEAFFFWVGCVRLGMENHFFVEAKSSFSVEIGKLKLQPEERRKGFAGVVSLGPRCEAWLIETVEEVLQSIGAEEFIKTTLDQVVGCRTGFILLPEGRDGQGSSRFSGKLSKVALFEAMRGPPFVG
jgi:hypothetical protein